MLKSFVICHNKTQKEIQKLYQKSASIIMNRHKASIPDACKSGYCKKIINSCKLKKIDKTITREEIS